MKYRKSDLQKEMRQHLNNKYYTHVYAEIYGTPMYLNEYEVRFLQCKCKLASEKGESEYYEFIKNHIVYNGPTKKGCTSMVFRTNGKFSTEFKSGFFDTAANLAFEIF